MGNTVDRSRTGLHLVTMLVLGGACVTELEPAVLPWAAGGDADAASGGLQADGELPCDVQDVLVAACHQCHGSTPAAGAPMSLVSYEDLMAPSQHDPSLSNLQRAVLRMKDAASPMPPGGVVGSGQVAVLEAWLSDGAPHGGCVPPDGTGGGGSYDPVCSSDQYWTGGDDGSPKMHPGGACISCHEQDDDAPLLHAGGTVYPTAHEPDDCHGSAGAIVEITDATGQIFSLTTNANGNFLIEQDEVDSFVTPISARVLYQGRQRQMEQQVETGNCNSCHTEAGSNGAPGRIMLP